MIVVAVKFGKNVRYNHEIILIKYAEPNQATHFIRYFCVFVITVIVITVFDCIFIGSNNRPYFHTNISSQFLSVKSSHNGRKINLIKRLCLTLFWDLFH